MKTGHDNYRNISNIHVSELIKNYIYRRTNLFCLVDYSYVEFFIFISIQLNCLFLHVSQASIFLQFQVSNFLFFTRPSFAHYHLLQINNNVIYTNKKKYVLGKQGQC